MYALCVCQWKLRSSWISAVRDHACSQAFLESLYKLLYYSMLQTQLINILNVILVSFSSLSCLGQTQVAVSFGRARLKPTLTSLSSDFWRWAHLCQRQQLLSCSSVLRIIVPMFPLGMNTRREEKTLALKALIQMHICCKLFFLFLYVQFWNKTNSWVQIFISSSR